MVRQVTRACHDEEAISQADVEELIDGIEKLNGELRRATRLLSAKNRLKEHILLLSHGQCEARGDPDYFESSHTEADLQLHFIRPLAAGGEPQPSNTVLLCRTCHERAHNETEAESFNSYLRQVAEGRQPTNGVTSSHTEDTGDRTASPGA
jgi:hypothetical protein